MAGYSRLWNGRRQAAISLLLVLVACGCTKAPGSQGVRIVRDEYGTPHVYADEVYGLYFGYGYSIAQDRLFQMDMARRSTQGTVAEVLGADYLDYDKNARTLFSPASIRDQMAALEQSDRDIFEGYAAGMNAWIGEIRKKPDELLPRQFSDFGFEPRDWSAYDVAMIFIGTMNNRYGDFNTELENAQILEFLVTKHGDVAGRALFDLLNPRFTDDAPTTIPRDDWDRPAYDSLAGQAAQTPLRSAPNLVAQSAVTAGFSNCYVIGKEKVAGANSILVNGPQFGWFNPSYVYSIGMHGAGIDVVGNSPFGYPMIMFGHNRTISWGSTWGASDIVDIFVEQLNPDNRAQYFYDGEYRDLEHRVERIDVKGADSVEFDIYRSVHGPIIRLDDAAGVAYAKKRAWDGIELETLLAWLYATWAKDWNEWKAEAEKSAINVNMYFADVDGNIGYFHGGRFPLRAPGHDNRLPVTGDGSMDWRGRQPVDTANPHVLNPGTHYIANWNNKPGQGVMNPDFFFYSWSAADRVEFLEDALEEKERLTPDEAWQILDSSSHADVFAPYFLPLIDDALSGSEDPDLRAANDVLHSWNRQSRDDDADGFYDEPATALFRSFVSALIKNTLSDDLGGVYPFFAASGYPTREKPTSAGTNIQAGVKAIVAAINGDSSFDIFNGEAPGAVIARSMRDALDDRHGDRLRVAKRPFLTRNFLGIPQAGADELKVTPIEQNRGTENNMIVMRPDAIVGWEVTPPGQSAFISPDGIKNEHYDDQLDMYQQFGKKRMWFYSADIEANKKAELIINY